LALSIKVGVGVEAAWLRARLDRSSGAHLTVTNEAAVTVSMRVMSASDGYKYGTAARSLRPMVTGHSRQH